MNHGTESVVRHVVQGDKSRAGDFFSQPLNGEKFLLQGQSCTPQGVKAAHAERAEEEGEFNLKQHVKYKKYKFSILEATAATSFSPVVI